MRISDWSSDVCSSDLANAGKHQNGGRVYPLFLHELNRTPNDRRQGRCHQRMDTPHPRLGQDIDQPREGGIYNDFCSETAAEQVHDAGTSAIDANRHIISELTNDRKSTRMNSSN